MVVGKDGHHILMKPIKSTILQETAATLNMITPTDHRKPILCTYVPLIWFIQSRVIYFVNLMKTCKVKMHCCKYWAIMSFFSDSCQYAFEFLTFLLQHKDILIKMSLNLPHKFLDTNNPTSVFLPTPFQT